MQLYVETALRGLDIDLVFCSSVAEAAAAFDRAPVRLLITDLMLPGQSGVELLEQIQADPVRYGVPRTVVASAAIDASGIRARLRELGVWRILPKPVSLDALEACVIDALAAPERRVARTPAPPTAAPADAGAAELHPSVVEAFFGGDHALHSAFRSACVRQFESDMAVGDRCVREGDAPALRRLAHSLKTVLGTLGAHVAAAAAWRLEASAEAADLPGVQVHWPVLREALQALRRDI